MQSKAGAYINGVRRPLHPFLVPFPLVFFGMSFVFDLLSLRFGASMVEAALYNVVGGLVAAGLSAVAGLWDYRTQLERRSNGRRLARWHALINVVAVLLFAAGLGDRWAARGAEVTPRVPFILSALGVVLLGVSSYVGGVILHNFSILRRAP
jgi:uncharacterized membrane protein